MQDAMPITVTCNLPCQLNEANMWAALTIMSRTPAYGGNGCAHQLDIDVNIGLARISCNMTNLAAANNDA